MAKLAIIYITFFFILFTIACSNASTESKEQNLPNIAIKDSTSVRDTTRTSSNIDTVPYDLAHPRTTFKLPKKLEEISGLSISSNGKMLCAVQDENGIIFHIDINNGKVISENKFGKDGDYEGIEVVNDITYVIKSKGKIYEIAGADGDEVNVEKHESTFLTRSNDVEGLGYDEKNNRLLLSCKGKAGKEDKSENKKCIFGFDLESKQFDTIPLFTINRQQIQEFLKTDPLVEKMDKFAKFFNKGEELIFGPSGIAVHPKTSNIYMVSSVGKVLLVLKPDGSIFQIKKLDKKIHPQPEGIAFDKDGTLYISNEGKEKKARIHIFDMLTN